MSRTDVLVDPDWVEAHTEKPMVPLRFFKSPTFTGANIDAFAVMFLIAGLAFFGTLYLQNVLGFSPVQAGMALIPMVIVMMFGAPASGALVFQSRFSHVFVREGERWVCIAGQSTPIASP